MKFASSLQIDSTYLKKHQIFALVCVMMLLCYPVYWAWALGAFSFYYIWPTLLLMGSVFVTYHASKEPPPAKWFAVSAFQVAWIIACYLTWTISLASGTLGFPFQRMGLGYLTMSVIYVAYLATLPGVTSLFPKCWTIAVPSWLLGLWFFHWVVI